jgi:hypothetical protein
MSAREIDDETGDLEPESRQRDGANDDARGCRRRRDGKHAARARVERAEQAARPERVPAIDEAERRDIIEKKTARTATCRGSASRDADDSQEVSHRFVSCHSGRVAIGTGPLARRVGLDHQEDRKK